MNRIIPFILLIFLISSCASRKDLVYFQSEEQQAAIHQGTVNATKLQEGDILAISISADDIRATQPFNPMTNTANVSAPTYVIDQHGFIDFPKLGKIQLAGKTRTEAMDYLRSELAKFIVSPTVNVELTNFRITVLGEVKTPGTFPISNDKITLLEALGLAGDLTINGVRKNVLVIRDNNGAKQEYRVDLTSTDMLKSPVYYLAQNDVVYVEPNKAKIQSSKSNPTIAVFISAAGLLFTLINLLTR